MVTKMYCSFPIGSNSVNSSNLNFLPLFYTIYIKSKSLIQSLIQQLSSVVVAVHRRSGWCCWPLLAHCVLSGDKPSETGCAFGMHLPVKSNYCLCVMGRYHHHQPAYKTQTQFRPLISQWGQAKLFL